LAYVATTIYSFNHNPKAIGSLWPTLNVLGGVAMKAIQGLVIAALGQALMAIADIASNSARSADYAARTVAFFAHMSGTANRSTLSPNS
jgi:hypothetical protein